MELNLNGIVIICGTYGSGKTEIAINLAMYSKQSGKDVCLADLDLINPYFRTQEAEALLKKGGVALVLPSERYIQSDLFVLNPTISGLIRNPRELTILDVGGDKPGASVLSVLADAIAGKDVTMLQVINPFRPFTETVEACIDMLNALQESSKLMVTGFIGNANIMDETLAEDIHKGYDFVKQVSDKAGLPIAFITCPLQLFSEINFEVFPCPVMPVKRHLLPPWKK
ncbi:MAG: cobalamin biosynthesis protein CbiA [Desulfobacterales bacterium]|nr:cobalamin biosynthesis protein CbiA [Desulfobacterales bacterium]